MKQDKLKILMIEPPFYRLFKKSFSLTRFPLSFGYLAGAVIRQTNWKVKVYNADFSPQQDNMSVSYLTGEGSKKYLACLSDLSQSIWDEVRTNIEKYKPLVLAVSVKSQNLLSARLVAKIAKKIDDRICVVVGGPHVSMVGSEILDCPDFDVAIKGEGEKTIIDLLKAIETGQDLDRIKGIIFRKDNKVIDNGAPDFIENLDSLSFPFEHAGDVLVDFEKYPLRAFKNIFSIRGCPYNCTFCGSRKIWGQKPRFRSVENVTSEMSLLMVAGIKFVNFADDTFGVNRAHIRKLCNEIINRCPGIKWSCELHVKLVDEETIAIMKEAGCRSIQIGIESGNNEILKQIKKGITIEEAIAAANIIKKNGIQLQVFFMIGFPQETISTIKDTKKAIRKINADSVTLSIFVPYKGTELFELCKGDGLVSDDFNVSLHHHQSSDNYFCKNIKPEVFRNLVSEIEQFVDRKNRINSFKKMFSLRVFDRIRELGVLESFKSGLKLFVKQ